MTWQAFANFWTAPFARAVHANLLARFLAKRPGDVPPSPFVQLHGLRLGIPRHKRARGPAADSDQYESVRQDPKACLAEAVYGCGGVILLLGMMW